MPSVPTYPTTKFRVSHNFSANSRSRGTGLYLGKSTPFMTTAIFPASIPRPIRFFLNAGVSATTQAAERYRYSSSFSTSRNRKPCPIAPTATIEAGHKSPSSKTKGIRRILPTNHPATATKNWGEVEMTTSGFFSNNPARMPLNIKLRKSMVRRMTPELDAMKVFTRTTRMPPISSTARSRFLYPLKILP